MIPVVLLLMLTMRSTAAWSLASHFTAVESTTTTNQLAGAAASTFHAWWKKSEAPSKKAEGEFRKVGSGHGNDDLLIVSTSSTTVSEPEDSAPTFFIRPALKEDVGPGSKILADGFFKDSTNFITFQFERLETFLSLDLGFPKPNTRHELFVACEQSGKVLGIAEVDARTNRPNIDSNGPYLCNVAVDLNHLRQGIATALVEKCEAQVQKWVYDESVAAQVLNDRDGSRPRLSSSMHLKVRQNNAKAVNMYQKLGYQSILLESDKKYQTVLVMRKQLELLEKKLDPAEEGIGAIG